MNVRIIDGLVQDVYLEVLRSHNENDAYALHAYVCQKNNNSCGISYGSQANVRIGVMNLWNN